MFKKNLLVVIAILFIGASIIINGYFIENAIKSANLQNPITTSVDDKVLNLSQTAEYLNMSEEDIRGIIQTEKNILEKTSSFNGKMFPYFTINNKENFYKNEIDEWLKEVSSNRREYNTTDGWIF